MKQRVAAAAAAAWQLHTTARWGGMAPNRGLLQMGSR